MKNRTAIIIAWGLLILGGIISIYFISKTSYDGFWIWGSKTDFTTTGQFGDFFGGVIGTAFALAGTLLIFLSFNEQTKQNKKVTFETTFFQMVNLHRENVNQFNYTKSNGKDLQKAVNRKVFRVIFQEFIECYREVKKFSNSKDVNDYILPKHIKHLEKIIKNNGLKTSLIELAVIDIAYNIIFYGVGNEGEIVLRSKFKYKYNHPYFYQLIKYLKLKPKKENKKRWLKWEAFMKLPFKEFKKTNLEFYNYRKHNSKSNLSENAEKLVYSKEYNKYYGGHQHRLGHYFRHLFQSYKFLNYHNDLTVNEKYFYGKTLRAQLSTYEQALLFINSISDLGMKWELTPEINLLNKKENTEDSKLITKFNLIKNLPGKHFSGIRYKNFYPKIKYESDES